MRCLILALLALGTVVAAPVSAQRYDSTSPICKASYERGGPEIECGFTSLEQCQASAAGLPASCSNNPYYAGPPAGSRPREPRKAHRPAI